MLPEPLPMSILSRVVNVMGSWSSLQNHRLWCFYEICSNSKNRGRRGKSLARIVHSRKEMQCFLKFKWFETTIGWTWCVFCYYSKEEVNILGYTDTIFLLWKQSVVSLSLFLITGSVTENKWVEGQGEPSDCNAAWPWVKKRGKEGGGKGARLLCSPRKGGRGH